MALRSKPTSTVAGELLFTAQWPIEVDLRFGVLQPSRALGLTTDSLGVQRVVRLRIEGPPGDRTVPSAAQS